MFDVWYAKQLTQARFESDQPRARVHYTLRGVGTCVEWRALEIGEMPHAAAGTYPNSI